MLRRALRLPLAVRLPRRPRAVARAAAWLLGAVALWHAYHVFLGTNFHAVIPGKVYRSNQPSGDELRDAIARQGVRTVLNLRGHCPAAPSGWYLEECRATCAAGVSQEDITLSALRLPPPAELRRLIEVLDHTEYPVLIHCKAGADRTGLVSAMVLLLYTDASLAQARRQLWPVYGHFRFGRVAAMDDFFDRYERWLAGRPHAPGLFRDWALNHYSPGPARGTLALAGGGPGDRRHPVGAGEWLALKVTATNTSAEAWELKPGNQAGVHLVFVVQSEAGEEVYRGQAGLFRRTVPPGGSVGLTVAVPPLREPGLYVLKADLVDATGAAVPIRASPFYQFGNDPLLTFVEVK